MGLVDAARAAKVEHCVFVSVSGNLLKHGDKPLFDAKKAVENHLRESGLTFTISPQLLHRNLVEFASRFRFRNAKAWPILPCNVYRIRLREML